MVYQECVNLGLEIDHWQSDLYVAKTKESIELMERLKKTNPKEVMNLTQFKGTDKRYWYEIPFAYQPYWNQKGLRMNNAV
jgi:hypothetical protein